MLLTFTECLPLFFNVNTVHCRINVQRSRGVHKKGKLRYEDLDVVWHKISARTSLDYAIVVSWKTAITCISHPKKRKSKLRGKYFSNRNGLAIKHMTIIQYVSLPLSPWLLWVVIAFIFKGEKESNKKVGNFASKDG